MAMTKEELKTAIDAGLITWESVRAGLMRLAAERSEWAGYPCMVQGYNLKVERKYPIQFKVCSDKDVREDFAAQTLVINRWYCSKLGVFVGVGERNGKRVGFINYSHRVTTYIDLLACAQAWDLQAEYKAQEKLFQLVGDHKFEQYQLTSTFMETSKRSGVTYLFRRSRPTLAFRGERALCALCLHPIGYFDGTHAGAMVPTDDVIAHLVFMRGDEPKFWANANQHHVIEPQAGV